MRHIRLRHPLLIALAIAMALLAPLGTSASIAPDDDPGSPARLSDLATAGALFEAVFNGHDADAAARLLSDDAVITTPDRVYTGPQGLLAYLAAMRRAYGDVSFETWSTSRSGDTIVVHWTLTGTRYQVDRTEEPIAALVRMPGETSIVISDGQVTQLTQTHGDLVVRTQADIAIVTGHAPSQ